MPRDAEATVIKETDTVPARKVVRVISRLNIGGPAIHAILLSSSLNENGYRDILITGSPSESEGDMLYLAKEKNVEPLVVPELGREISPVRDIKAFFKLYSIMRRERPDIVHTHMAKAGAIGRLAAYLAGVPVKVHTFHGHIFDGYFNPVKARIFLYIERLLALLTDKVVVVSERIKDDIVERLRVVRRDKCVVIRLGLELEKYLDCERRRGSFRRAIGVDEATLLVGIVSRLVPIKNHRMFLQAARKIRMGNPSIKVKFVVIGDGELKQQLKSHVRELGLEDDVVFTGWVEDLVSAYADLDIVALTSLNEGTPVSLIEAMASARPVVATDVGGVRDVVEDGASGLLVAPNDVDSFASKLAELMNDAAKRKILGSRGRVAVMERYSKDHLVDEIDSLYKVLSFKKGAL